MGGHSGAGAGWGDLEWVAGGSPLVQSFWAFLVFFPPKSNGKSPIGFRRGRRLGMAESHCILKNHSGCSANIAEGNFCFANAIHRVIIQLLEVEAGSLQPDLGLYPSFMLHFQCGLGQTSISEPRFPHIENGDANTSFLVAVRVKDIK